MVQFWWNAVLGSFQCGDGLVYMRAVHVGIAEYHRQRLVSANPLDRSEINASFYEPSYRGVAQDMRRNNSRV